MEQFWKKVNQLTPQECWEWTGQLTEKGYGKIRKDRFSNLPRRAHRAAWVLTNGQIPDKLQVLHSCDNPRCCNPAHLWLGTPADNMADKIQKGRANNPKGEDHPNTKLTKKQAEEILNSTEPHSILAFRYNVSYSTILNLKSGNTWGHLDRSSAQKSRRKKLSSEQEKEIRESKSPIRVLAKEYGVSGNTIRNIRHLQPHPNRDINRA